MEASPKDPGPVIFCIPEQLRLTSCAQVPDGHAPWGGHLGVRVLAPVEVFIEMEIDQASTRPRPSAAVVHLAEQGTALQHRGLIHRRGTLNALCVKRRGSKLRSGASVGAATRRDVPLLMAEESGELFVLDVARDAEPVESQLQSGVVKVHAGSEAPDTPVPDDAAQLTVLVGNAEDALIEGSPAADFVFPGADDGCLGRSGILGRLGGGAACGEDRPEKEENQLCGGDASHRISGGVLH